MECWGYQECRIGITLIAYVLIIELSVVRLKWERKWGFDVNFTIYYMCQTMCNILLDFFH